MNLPFFQIALIAAAAIAVIWAVSYMDPMISARYRAPFRIGVVAAVAVAFFYGVQRLAPNVTNGSDFAKGAIAVVAAGCVFYEMYSENRRRPIAERWKKFVGITLAVASFIAYFNGGVNGYHKFYHRHELYHYYLGAKYFQEMGYDGLYKCTVIAQDEMGVYTYTDEDTGRQLRIDMKKEARHPDRKVRNLGDDNLLVSAGRFLDNPAECKSPQNQALRRWTDERWEAFKNDIAFFRVVAGQDYFNKMQQDHGFNPPPVWTIMGKVFSELHVATTGYMQLLSCIDYAYILGMFAMLAWAFGWRVACVGVIFWGCNSTAPMLWTCGAFLRQDYMFYLVASVCLLRKKYPALGAAALVYSALLRIFPGLLAVGWVVVLGWQLWKHKRPTREQVRMVIGGVLAAAILVGISVKLCGVDSYSSFYTHTLKVHDQTPLTNHVGLRVLIAQTTPVEIPALGIGVDKDGCDKGNPDPDKCTGRMKYRENNSQPDPFFFWKKMRNDRYQKLKPVGWAIMALTIALYVVVARRMKNMWLAACTSQIFLIVLAQLTSYYYAFMILGAPISAVKPLRRPVELTLFGFLIMSQAAFPAFRYNDDKYWVLTLLSMILCYVYILIFAPRAWWDWICNRLPIVDQAARALGIPGGRPLRAPGART